VIFHHYHHDAQTVLDGSAGLSEHPPIVLITDGGATMQPSLLEELTPVPSPYPIRSEVEYPDVWRLCEQARELAWNPASIDFSDLREADIPTEVREAGAEWWSLRAWMEHGAVPYGTERLREAIFRHFVGIGERDPA